MDNLTKTLKEGYEYRQEYDSATVIYIAIAVFMVVIVSALANAWAQKFFNHA